MTIDEARCRRVAALYWDEGRSINEIAELIGCSDLVAIEMLMRGQAIALWELSRRQLSHIAIKRCGIRADWKDFDIKHIRRALGE